MNFGSLSRGWRLLPGLSSPFFPGTFWTHGGLTSVASRNKGIDTRIGKKQQTQFCVSFIALFSKNAKLSVFKLVFVPILICGHES